MTSEEKALLKTIQGSPQGRIMVKYLKSELSDLKDVTKAKSWEETQGRQYAVKVIEKLFSFLDEQPKAKKSKNQYT